MGQRKLIGLGALGSAGSAFRGESKFSKFAVGGEEGTGSMETVRTTVQRSYRKSLTHPVDSPGLLFLKPAFVLQLHPRNPPNQLIGATWFSESTLVSSARKKPHKGPWVNLQIRSSTTDDLHPRWLHPTCSIPRSLILIFLRHAYVGGAHMF